MVDLQAVDFWAIQHTELGWIALAMRGKAIVELTFGHPDPHSAVSSLESDLGQAAEVDPAELEICQRLERFAAGDFDSFADVKLADEELTDFRRRIVSICRDIPYGETRTYGELAELAGAPRAARAVGTTMSTNRFPLIVPCHRVVGANGSLGGYSAPDGLAMKRRLLDMEANAKPVAT